MLFIIVESKFCFEISRLIPFLTLFSQFLLLPRVRRLHAFFFLNLLGGLTLPLVPLIPLKFVLILQK